MPLSRPIIDRIALEKLSADHTYYEDPFDGVVNGVDRHLCTEGRRTTDGTSDQFDFGLYSARLDL